jgi:hypothetical protein
MMRLFPDTPLNIEMKDDAFRRDHIGRFVNLLDAHRGKRPILVASQSRSLLARFREERGERYPTSLPVGEALPAVVRGVLPLLGNGMIDNRALQSSHAAHLTPPNLIQEMKRAGDAVHSFLNRTWFLTDSLDKGEGTPTRQEAFATPRPRGRRGP